MNFLEKEKQKNNTKQAIYKRNDSLFNPLYLLIPLIIIILVIGGSIYLLTHTPIGASLSNVNVTPTVSPTPTTCDPIGTSVCDTKGNIINIQNVTEIKEDVGLKTITLKGSYSKRLSLDSKTGLVYIANGAGAECSALDPTSTPVLNKTQSNTLSIINPILSKETFNLATENGAIQTILDNKRNVVYILGKDTGKVSIHDIKTGKKLSTIDVGGQPSTMAINEDKGIMIVGNTADDTGTTFSTIDLNTKKVLNSQKFVNTLSNIIIDNDLAYIIGNKDGTVAIIDITTGNVKSTFTINGNFSKGVNTLVYSSTLRQLFIANSSDASSILIVNIDSHAIVGSISFGQKNGVISMQIDTKNNLLYAVLQSKNAIGIADISSFKPLGTISVDPCPYDIKLDTDRNLAFVTSQTQNVLDILDLKKINSLVKK